VFHQPPLLSQNRPCFIRVIYKFPRRATQRARRIYEKVAHLQETRHCSTPKSHVRRLTRLNNVDEKSLTQPLSRHSQTCPRPRRPRPYERVSRRISPTSRVSSKWRSRGIIPSPSPKPSPISFRCAVLPPLHISKRGLLLWAVAVYLETDCKSVEQGRPALCENPNYDGLVRQPPHRTRPQQPQPKPLRIATPNNNVLRIRNRKGRKYQENKGQIF
jgi:hypothetical protein